VPYPLSYVRAYLDSYGGLLGTRIEVIDANGEWFVRVVEDVEERTYSFVLESVALAFAEGQRMRLELPAIVRL
jgi:hypothetical protein